MVKTSKSKHDARSKDAKSVLSMIGKKNKAVSSGKDSKNTKDCKIGKR